MLKKILVGAVLVLSASAAWAGSAGYCLHVVSANNISGRALKNDCNEDVEASWCYGVGCKLNNTWTIRAGQEFPLEGPSAGAFVNYDACSGANSIKSYASYGLVCR
jgi:hypothetical protein